MPRKSNCLIYKKIASPPPTPIGKGMRIKKQHLKGALFVYSILPRRKKVLKMASYRKLKSGWKVTISQRDENGKLRQTSKGLRQN